MGTRCISLTFSVKDILVLGGPDTHDSWLNPLAKVGWMKLLVMGLMDLVKMELNMTMVGTKTNWASKLTDASFEGPS